jgi:hypothetical protein
MGLQPKIPFTSLVPDADSDRRCAKVSNGAVESIVRLVANMDQAAKMARATCATRMWRNKVETWTSSIHPRT